MKKRLLICCAVAQIILIFACHMAQGSGGIGDEDRPNLPNLSSSQYYGCLACGCMAVSSLLIVQVGLSDDCLPENGSTPSVPSFGCGMGILAGLGTGLLGMLSLVYMIFKSK